MLCAVCCVKMFETDDVDTENSTMPSSPFNEDSSIPETEQSIPASGKLSRTPSLPRASASSKDTCTRTSSSSFSNGIS